MCKYCIDDLKSFIKKNKLDIDFSKLPELKIEVLEDGTQVLKRCDVCREITDYQDTNGYELHRDCACVKSWRKQARLKRFKDLSIIDRSQRNNIFKNAVFESEEERKIYQELYRYAQGFRIDKYGYIFMGDVGTGKTFLASCVCNMLEENNFTVLSFNLSSYLGKIRIDSNNEELLIQAVRDVDLLFIADLGSEYINRENGKMWAEDKLFRLFDERYRTQKPLFITTNLTTGELKEHIKINGSNKIYDRLLEMCKLINFTGESKRKAKMIG